MKLKWNPESRCFEAEFQDFQSDLTAVKAAGFRTTGPPEWIWYTDKISVLENLRGNRPASGLTIFEDALTEYKRIKKESDAVTALLKELKAAKAAEKAEKAQKKQATESEPELVIPESQEFGYNCVEDIEPKVRVDYIPPVWTGPNCHICNGPVYFYEQQNPPTCLYCEKQLDNSEDLF